MVSGAKASYAQWFCLSERFSQNGEFSSERPPSSEKKMQRSLGIKPPQSDECLCNRSHTGGVLLGKSEGLLKTINELRWGKVELMPHSWLPCEYIRFCSFQSGFLLHTPIHMGTHLLFFLLPVWFLLLWEFLLICLAHDILESRSLLFSFHLVLHGRKKRYQGIRWGCWWGGLLASHES